MSGLLAGKVWHSRLPAVLKPLAACLADEGNNQGKNIFPSIGYLAWKLGISPRSVQRRMAELRQLGVICEVSKKRFGRISIPNYYFDVSKLPHRKSWSETRQGDSDDVTSVSGDASDMTSQRDTVTSVTPRGDTAVAPNPLVDPLVEPGRKEFAAKKASPPDSRYQPFYNFAFHEFELKHLQPPTWGAKHGKALKLFLNGNRHIDLCEWQCRYLAFLASPNRFFQQQKGSLAYFVANFDAFIEANIPERTYENGKPKIDANQRTVDNLRAAGLADDGGDCA
jgi:biotin operon repressor